MAVLTASAATVFNEAARDVAAGTQIDEQWAEKIEHLSVLCIAGKASTHIAFLGTSILAKATTDQVDLMAIKPDHAPGNPHSYSARILSETVLVPLAAEHSVHIGVTGRQPLNNQPYFRMTSLGDGTPVHTKSRPAFDYMLELVHELQNADVQIARAALRAFISVRQRYWPRYAIGTGSLTVTAETLATKIEALVREDSEGGARAQAVAAGLLDVFAGDGRVETGRINDPSRHYPGDVCVIGDTESGNVTWEKAIEVRDKPVASSDVHLFCAKCAQSGAREAAILMVAPGQDRLDDASLRAAAERSGIGLTLFYGWEQFVSQALFWASAPKVLAAVEAVERIERRLIGVEASPRSVEMWHALTRVDSP